MPLVNRELDISYGSFEVGGTTDRLIHGHVKISKQYDRAEVEFEFLIRKETEAAFATECAAVEDAFRKVRQNVTVTQGSATLASFSQSSFSGFDSAATIYKRDDDADTGRSRLYGVRIEFGMPADSSNSGSGTSGRRSSMVNVAYGPQRLRTVTVTGTWTALSSVDSRTQYGNQIVAFGAAVMTALGITNYEVDEEPETQDNTASTVLTFTRIYRELIYPQSLSGTNDTAIVRQSIQFIPHSQSPGDSPDGGAKRLIEVSVIYEAWIDKTVSQDLSGKWTGSILPFLLQKVRTVFNAGTVALVHQYPDFDPVQNKISARLEIWSTAGSSVLLYSVRTADHRLHGKIPVPAWTKDGNPFSRFLFQGPAQILRTITETARYLASAVPPTFDDLPDGGAPPRTMEGFAIPDSIVVSSSESRTPIQIGLQEGGGVIDAVDFEKETVREYMNIIVNTKAVVFDDPSSGTGRQQHSGGTSTSNVFSGAGGTGPPGVQ